KAVCKALLYHDIVSPAGLAAWQKVRLVRFFPARDSTLLTPLEGRRTLPAMPHEGPPPSTQRPILLVPTPAPWVDAVRADFDAFLRDHAACERKASATAMTLASHYRDKEELVTQMVDLACEELHHFRKVYACIVARGGRLGDDTKDRYVRELLGLARRAPEVYLLDRLLVAGVIEARGCERFHLLAAALEPDLATFYADFARSEARHAGL